MIYGIGTDIIEVERIKKNLLYGKDLKTKLFTDKEIAYCDEKKRFAEHFAARFAAKEAFFKALGTGWRNGFAFTEIEITNDQLGKPSIEVSGKIKDFVNLQKITNIQLSISHIKDTAIAFVTLEKL